VTDPPTAEKSGRGNIYSKMKGYGFRRQRSIISNLRTSVLPLAGFTVLHFTDEEVLNNLSQVEQKIMKWIEEKEKQNI